MKEKLFTMNIVIKKLTGLIERISPLSIKRRARTVILVNDLRYQQRLEFT